MLPVPPCPISQTLTHPLPPVYTYLVGFEIVTAHTTSPWLRVLICRAWRGIPCPLSASGGKGTGCIWPSLDTWKLYALKHREKFAPCGEHASANYPIRCCICLPVSPVPSTRNDTPERNWKKLNRGTGDFWWLSLFVSFFLSFFLSRGKSISFRRVELKPVRSIFKRCAIALGRNFEEINWKQRIFFFWREEREENEIIFKGDDFYRYVIDTRSRFFFSKGNVVNITGKTQFIILIFPISLYLERLICR